MAVKKWKTSKKFKGVRFYEHETRKCGPRLDRNYYLRYSLAGRRYEEPIGWASEGWNEEKVASLLIQLNENHAKGTGALTIDELRQQAEEAKAEREAQREQEARDNLTFGEFFQKTYLPHARHDKSANSIRNEVSLFNKWINPVLGELAMSKISPMDIERIKHGMASKKRAKSSQTYALAVVRQVLNRARDLDFIHGDNAVSKVKMPKFDNRRTRFLEPEEAETLLNALREKSATTYRMALLSLHCGLREKEITGLTWGCVDLKRGIVQIRDTKNKTNRVAYLTDQAGDALLEMGRGNPTDRVFLNRKGQPIKEVSRTFDRTVEAVGLNAGIEDRRDKVVFHSLRHTFASWLAQRGTPLYTLSKLLGHKTITMTQRYAHLADEQFVDAANTIQSIVSNKNEDETKKVVKIV